MAEESSNKQPQASAGAPRYCNDNNPSPEATTKALDSGGTVSNATMDTISTGNVVKVESDKNPRHQQPIKKKLPGMVSDERDEKGQKATPRSSGAKTQQRAPPSPHPTIEANESHTPINRLNIFDWPDEENHHAPEAPKTGMAKGSSLKQGERERQYRASATDQKPGAEDSKDFLLFTHSFDTLSENGDYLRGGSQPENYGLLASPVTRDDLGIPQHDPATPRMDIALPALDHYGSDCSMLDVSPIKIAHRHSPTSAPAASNFHQRPDMTNLGPPHSIAQASSARGRGGMSGESKSTHHPTPGTNPDGTQRSEYDYHWRQHGQYPRETEEQVSNPFFVIRSCQRAFGGCTYLLPCLRETNLVSVNLNRYGHIRRYQGHPQELDPDSMDLVIAKRRIETAICLFGGSLNPKKPSQTSSIFRLKHGGSSKPQYDQRSSKRYHLTEGRISWDVEANPPIDLDGKSYANKAEFRSRTTPNVIVDDAPGGSKRPRLESASPESSFDNADAPKMKYRCKLCGQPKQNHNCTFRQSLQRSIGVQICSAVNAYTACEPGSLAPTLSKMNNFVSYDSGQGSPPGEEVGYTQTEDSQCHPSTVTPQSARESGGVLFHSPQSSLSTHSQVMSPHHADLRSKDGGYHVHFSHHTAMKSGDNKGTHSQVVECHDNPVQHAAFAPAAPLRPEQYRAVTAAVTPFRGGESASSAAGRKASGSGGGGSYQYPPVPLTFGERKCMSDTLFYFSKEIPNMTQGCALALREARERNDWDQAVAELLTQVIVGLYCGEGDCQLEGLQQYLLTLGVSC